MPLNGNEIIIVEQADDKPFNRGKLLNIGALHSRGSFICMHDVDHVPNKHTTYEAAGTITQLVHSDIQTRDFLGGVTIFLRETFFTLGGYHNDYFSRAEDNEMVFNIQRRNYHVVHRPQPFTLLNHTRPAVEFDRKLWDKAKLKRDIYNQLGACEFILVSDEQNKYFRHLSVKL